jgi:hypothetical protein
MEWDFPNSVNSVRCTSRCPGTNHASNWSIPLAYVHDSNEPNKGEVRNLSLSDSAKCTQNTVAASALSPTLLSPVQLQALLYDSILLMSPRMRL